MDITEITIPVVDEEKTTTSKESKEKRQQQQRMTKNWKCAVSLVLALGLFFSSVCLFVLLFAYQGAKPLKACTSGQAFGRPHIYEVRGNTTLGQDNTIDAVVTGTTFYDKGNPQIDVSLLQDGTTAVLFQDDSHTKNKKNKNKNAEESSSMARMTGVEDKSINDMNITDIATTPILQVIDGHDYGTTNTIPTLDTVVTAMCNLNPYVGINFHTNTKDAVEAEVDALLHSNCRVGDNSTTNSKNNMIFTTSVPEVARATQKALSAYDIMDDFHRIGLYMYSGGYFLGLKFMMQTRLLQGRTTGGATSIVSFDKTVFDAEPDLIQGYVDDGWCLGISGLRPEDIGSYAAHYYMVDTGPPPVTMMTGDDAEKTTTNAAAAAQEYNKDSSLLLDPYYILIIVAALFLVVAMGLLFVSVVLYTGTTSPCGNTDGAGKGVNNDEEKEIDSTDDDEEYNIDSISENEHVDEQPSSFKERVYKKLYLKRSKKSSSSSCDDGTDDAERGISNNNNDNEKETESADDNEEEYNIDIIDEYEHGDEQPPSSSIKERVYKLYLKSFKKSSCTNDAEKGINKNGDEKSVDINEYEHGYELSSQENNNRLGELRKEDFVSNRAMITDSDAESMQCSMWLYGKTIHTHTHHIHTYRHTHNKFFFVCEIKTEDKENVEKYNSSDIYVIYIII